MAGEQVTISFAQPFIVIPANAGSHGLSYWFEPAWRFARNGSAMDPRIREDDKIVG